MDGTWAVPGERCLEGWEKIERRICVCLSSGPSLVAELLEMLVQDSTLARSLEGMGLIFFFRTLPFLPPRDCSLCMLLRVLLS